MMDRSAIWNRDEEAAMQDAEILSFGDWIALHDDGFRNNGTRCDASDIPPNWHAPDWMKDQY